MLKRGLARPRAFRYSSRGLHGRTLGGRPGRRGPCKACLCGRGIRHGLGQCKGLSLETSSDCRYQYVSFAHGPGNAPESLRSKCSQWNYGRKTSLRPKASGYPLVVGSHGRNVTSMGIKENALERDKVRCTDGPRRQLKVWWSGGYMLTLHR